MRAGLTQVVPDFPADIRITLGADVYTSQDGGRLLNARCDERAWGGVYTFLIDNDDETLSGKTYEGVTAVAYFGVIGSAAGSSLHNIKVIKQELTSDEGELALKLTCIDNLALLQEFKGSVGGSLWNHKSQSPAALAEQTLSSGDPLPADLITAITAQYDKTPQDILTAVVAATLGCSISFVDDDSYINTVTPLVNASNALEVIAQALASTKCYIMNSGSGFKVVWPANHAVAYTFDVANLIFNNTEQRQAIIPNTIIFHGIDSTGVLLSTGATHGKDAASIALLGTISQHFDYDVLDRESSTTQAEVDDKADLKIAKLQLSAGSGTFKAPMHCSLEMFDKVSVVDNYYDTPRTVTGYVFRIIREYDRGVYDVTVQLGGFESGYSMSDGQDYVPSFTPDRTITPSYNAQYTLPRAIQGFNTDVVFTAGGQAIVNWTAGTIKFADGTTQSIDAGTYTLPTTSIYYFYFKLDDAAPTVLKTVADSGGGYNSVMTEQTGLICVAQKGSTATINANVLPSYGKQPLITPDLIHMTGLTSYDFGSGVTIAKVYTTEISAGHLKLTSSTVKSGTWYYEGGVTIDASAGIKIDRYYGAISTFSLAYAGVTKGYLYTDGTDVILYASGVLKIGATTMSGTLNMASNTINNCGHIYPTYDDSYNCGAGGNAWFQVVAHNVYWDNLGQAYDDYDDVELLKGIKTVKNEEGRKVLDNRNLPDSIFLEGSNRKYIKASSMQGLTIGIMKQMLSRIEALENRRP